MAPLGPSPQSASSAIARITACRAHHIETTSCHGEPASRSWSLGHHRHRLAAVKRWQSGVMSPLSKSSALTASPYLPFYPAYPYRRPFDCDGPPSPSSRSYYPAREFKLKMQLPMTSRFLLLHGGVRYSATGMEFKSLMRRWPPGTLREFVRHIFPM